jgi:Uma2 family endonuclease
VAGLAPRHRYTFRDYLDLEDVSRVRHEFYAGEIYAMAGGTPEHAALAGAVTTVLGSQLRGSPCRVYSSDLRVRVLATGLATYPDVTVVCGPSERDPESRTHVTNPKVIVEVLSPSTEEYDRGEKLEHYRQVPSLEAIVLIDYRERRVDVWSRRPAGWEMTTHRSGGTLRLAAIPCSLSIDEVYAAADEA